MVENKEKRKEPKIAVVLGTGSLTSLGAIPLIEFFHEWRVPIDLMYGSSGGALAAGLWGLDIDVKSILLAMPEIIYRTQASNPLNFKTLFSMFLPYFFKPTKGLWHSKNLLKSYRNIFQDVRVEDLQKRVIIGATDYESCDEVLITSGLLAEAIYASRALTPFLPPKNIETVWMCDGGWSNKYWIVDTIKHDYDIIIVLDITSSDQIRPKNFLDHVYQFFKKVNSERGIEYGHLIPGIIYLHHNVRPHFDSTGQPDVHAILNELSGFIFNSEDIIYDNINDYFQKKQD